MGWTKEESRRSIWVTSGPRYWLNGPGRKPGPLAADLTLVTANTHAFE